ncbi:MAG: tannase/feruloyl esterase family alpha/beta hydrolase [Pseudomonadota bacterium]
MKQATLPHIALFGASTLAIAIAGCGGSSATTPQTLAETVIGTVKPAAPCAGLAGMAIPVAAIGLPTSGATVNAAAPVTDTDASGAARDYCKVTGVINPVDPAAAPIRFEVNLPAAWNQRALQMGGGGTDGTVVTGLGNYVSQPVTQATALAQGFVTLGSDSGHNADKDPPFDTHFALNQEQLLNFGQYQVKKTLDTARALMKAYYGSAPRYTYFAGGSQGGHEAFDAAQRYPDDYDGVIAQFPAYNVVNMHLGAQAQAQAIYGNKSGVASAAWMNPAKVAMLVKAVATACDGLDGVTDGLISNVKACNAAFTIDTVKATLRCPDGADTGNTCLSDAQIGAVGKINSPVNFSFAFSGGSTSYPRWPILEGGTFLNNHLGKSNTAVNPPIVPFDPINGSAFQLLPAAGTIKGVITQNFDTDALAFDPNQWISRIKTVSGWMDASSTDLGRFKAKGGKMLMAHGTIDDSISPYNTINYYNRLVSDNGQATVDAFARFFLIPGFGHGEGIFLAKWDSLAALQAWVEKGVAPAGLVATDGNANTPTAGRTRPLCVYPQYPKYKGSGDVNLAASFECTNP